MLSRLRGESRRRGGKKGAKISRWFFRAGLKISVVVKVYKEKRPAYLRGQA